MIGKRTAQLDLYDVGNVYDVKLKPRSFHGQLVVAAPRLFKDADFAGLYSAKKGRPSVPPSQLALLVLLQAEAQVSDEEAVLRTGYDLRWAAVLRRSAGEPLCAKSTHQLFRAQLILHEAVLEVFKASIEEAKRTGLLKGAALNLALDTKPIIGRGAVEDTYNLVATGIRQLAASMARRCGKRRDAYLRDNGFERYLASSVKGGANIDWNDEEARAALLTALVADAKRLIALAATEENTNVRAAAKLLEDIMLQNVETKKQDDGSEKASVAVGTVKGRMPSATDPEVRHGRKSSSKRFDGHKASIAVDQESGICVACDVLYGDAPDCTGALGMVEQAEEQTGLKVKQTTADCAYGGGPTRQAFEDADRELYAKVGKECSKPGMYPKSAFKIDTDKETVTCPNGITVSRRSKKEDNSWSYSFGAACRGCPLRDKCTESKAGRKITVYEHEALLQAARKYQQTAEGQEELRKRVVVEHRLARLAQLGIGQARYKGHKKTLFQLIIACTIANLRLVWNKTGANTDNDPTTDVSLPRQTFLKHVITVYNAFSNIMIELLIFKWISARTTENTALTA